MFTGFTMAGLGMAAHHRRGNGPHRRRGIIVNLDVGGRRPRCRAHLRDRKFTEGAWAIVVIAPLMYYGLIRLHRQYDVGGQGAAREGRRRRRSRRALRRNVVYVLIDDYDLAAARAVQYARSLNPTELRAIHFDIDPGVTRELESTWAELGPKNLTLEVIECPDRRIERAALELAAEAARPVDTECTIVLPRRNFPTRLERVLHDRTADAIAEAVTLVPRASGDRDPVPPRRREAPPVPRRAGGPGDGPAATDAQRAGAARPTCCSPSARGTRRRSCDAVVA